MTEQEYQGEHAHHPHEHHQDHPHEHHQNHPHEHEHHQNHPHEHVSGHATANTSPEEETLALLAYMVSHNKHHAKELAELSAGVKGEAAAALKKAIDLFREGNEYLESALELMR